MATYVVGGVVYQDGRPVGSAPQASRPAPPPGGAGGGPGIVNTPGGPYIGTLPEQPDPDAWMRQPRVPLDIPPAPPGFGQPAEPAAPAAPAAPPVDMSARQNAIDFLKDTLRTWGLSGLDSTIGDLVVEFGPNAPAAIMERLRQSEPYKQRFKGMLDLQGRGVTDIANEADYIRFESEYRGVFREAGLRDFLGAAGSQQEIDAIGDLINKFSVSVNEVRARVSDAQRVAAQTPPEVRDALQRFYGVGAQDLVAYSLDPQRTMTRINEMANAAILGGMAARAGLDVGVGAAERLVGGVGDQDIDLGSVQSEMAQAREIRDATRRLAEIERGTLRDEEVLEARAGTDVAAGERIRGLQSRERARFGGSTAVGATTLRGERI